ncbi:MAG TPA: HD domain-containing phosphohydrolase [Dehalococcoidia bacterium]
MRISATLAWPARGLVYPARHIRWKIIAPYAALTIALAIAGTFLVTRLVSGSLDERFNNQLAEASRVASDALVRQERRHLETVRAVAFTEGVGSAAAARNGFLLAPLVEPLAANAGAERVEVLDTSGRRTYGARLADASTLKYASIVDKDDRSSWPIVQSVLDGATDTRGDKFTGIIDAAGDGEYVLYTAGPIYDGNRLAGVVLIGTPLSSFLALAKSQALTDVSIYGLDGTPLGSTFAAADTDIDLAPGSGVLDASATEIVREHRTMFGRDFDLAYAPLLLRGEAAGYYSVGLPSDFIFTAQSSTRTQMAALFTVAMLAALILGWGIARSITEPVSRLVAAANAVTAGDLWARSNVRGSDEIGVLGRAFDTMTERLQRQHLSTVKALTSAIDARDPYTMGHSLRVGQLAVEIGTVLRCSPATLQNLEIGGYLHDIGKIGVRDSVLLKPGTLTQEERAAIERHPTIGLDILEHVDLAPEVKEFVGGHHEKLDGRGYPQHLHGEELSIVARIASVADIYDALVTDRPYRSGMDVKEAVAILRREANEGQLDHRIVATLEMVLPRWEERRKADPTLRGYSIEPATGDANQRRAA